MVVVQLVLYVLQAAAFIIPQRVIFPHGVCPYVTICIGSFRRFLVRFEHCLARDVSRLPCAGEDVIFATCASCQPLQFPPRSCRNTDPFSLARFLLFYRWFFHVKSFHLQRDYISYPQSRSISDFPDTAVWFAKSSTIPLLSYFSFSWSYTRISYPFSISYRSLWASFFLLYSLNAPP